MGSRTYRYTGQWEQWDVPKDVEYVTVTLDGAGSGQRKGGRVSGRIRVNKNQTLFILVGEAGKANKGSEGGAATVGGGGAGGDGRGNPGGWSGGGATVIRLNSRTGMVRAVAAGAGGDSGDGGQGGQGGTLIGENGWPAGGYPGGYTDDDGNRFNPNVGNATGGTQVQGGNGGTSSAGTGYNGQNAVDGVLARAGRGGGGLPRTFGGGGGGGGYHPGGGGQAGFVDETPGGGGGGGSNYVGGMLGATNLRGEGSAGNGRVTLTWVDPPPANQPPTPPTEVRINGETPTRGYATQSTGAVTISAKLSDPKHTQKVRLIVQYSPDEDFRRQVKTERSDLVEQENNKTGKEKETGRASVRLTGLSRNTHYYARLYGQDAEGLRSVNYTAIDFWTNRDPSAPDQRLPGENVSIAETSSVQFEWRHVDPDANSTQSAFELQWRRARTPTTPAGDWVTTLLGTSFYVYVVNPGVFAANRFYEWRVRTRDQQGQWGPFSGVRSFFISGAAAPPTLDYPVQDEAVDVSAGVRFRWTFRDPDQGDTQSQADIRYRPVGSGAEQWFTVLGGGSTPGSSTEWTLPPTSFIPGVRYQWQARTRDTLTSSVSGWSDPATFHAVETPGIGGAPELLQLVTEPLVQLGIGQNRVFVYDRGGMVRRGELTSLARVTYSRKRDDIGNLIADTNGYSAEDWEFIGSLRSWIHEIVVFRDGVRVWEGPITRITYRPDGVEIEAKDVMAYIYRRILRQGYNDSYRIVNGEQRGLSTVVERAVRICMNALAPDDPNLLPYLTSLDFPDDARVSRSVPDYSRSAWEEIDDLAATAGLDYVAVGRRIIFWDTHRPLGRLPELRDENFSDPPIVTEYGMLTANIFAVTNNNGVYGLSTRGLLPGPYGLIEQVASSYGETEAGLEEALSQESREALEKTLTQQADRNISGRYPTPVTVRVPDNSALHPETPVGFNQLVPGVWVPIRAENTPRTLAQWQKLDLVTVEQTAQGERVMVTMSPAPNAGEDPDAAGGDTVERVEV